MITNKVLGEALEIECHSVVFLEGNTVKYNDHYVINIYELMHTCKKRAKESGYLIGSTLGSSTVTDRQGKTVAIFTSLGNHINEPEAVLLAYEWVLSEIAC